MDSTEDSDIPLSCEMKYEPSFKPLQGNSAFFSFRDSWCPFLLRQQIQGPSHIPIAEENLLLGCMWKVVIALQSKPGIQLPSRDDLGCSELSSSCCAEIGVTLVLRLVSQ